MEDVQSEYDFLNFSKDHYIKTNVTREEQIHFSDKILKKNKFGFNQERNIIITDKAIYNLKKNVLKRRIDLKLIRGVTVSKTTDEFVIHCNDEEYDYQYISQKKKTIVEIIAKYYYNITGEELKLFELNVNSLTTFVTSKKDKKREKRNSRMPLTNSISIGEYIYGAKSKTTVLKKQSTIKKTGKIVTNTKVEMDDFEIIKTIGRGSVGKILLVKYKNTGDYYTIKSMRKDQLLSENIIDNILSEKNILSDGQCEFLLTLSFFFQSPERIYFVTPFMKGGDLYHKLKTEGYLTEDLVRFYGAQVAIALQHLHEYGMAYRDLKPENILIDEDGYIKLCDFGASVHFQGTKKENTFAGSPEYASPEMIAQEGHNIMSDWWSFGILMYELFYGITPFFNMDKNRMFELIEIGELKFPKTIKIDGNTKPLKVSEEAKNLITKLLEKNPGSRLGRTGLNEIKSHPFFGNLNFDHIKMKKLKAPFKPTVSEDDLACNFDEEYTSMTTDESPVGGWISEYQEWFNDFEKSDDEQDDN
jgi:serum/glucocorticoid-regulated kinase 2